MLRLPLPALTVLGVYLWSGFGCALDIGQPCVGRSRLAGICTSKNDCNTTKASSFYAPLAPVKCGFKNLRPIICCESEQDIPNVFTEREKQTKRYQKCQEYQSAIYTTQSVLHLSSGSKSVETVVDQCAVNAVPLIVGGSQASLRQFPHSALLGAMASDEVTWICGGSLISRRFVLTAAHCLAKTKFGPLKVVRLGELDYLSDKDGAEPMDFGISQRISHPDYGFSHYNDIALLKLDRAVTINPNIRPICLPVKDDTPTKGVATGWGSVTFKGHTSSTLLKVTLETFSLDECNYTYTRAIDLKLPRGIIDSQMCAGSRSQARDTCQGDSGGPFQIYHPSIYCMYTQVGVTSFGQACGIVNLPGIYTRVSSYVEWIEKLVWPDGQVDELQGHHVINN